MRLNPLSAPLACVLALAATVPAAQAGTPRLVIAGDKSNARVFIDLTSRRAEGAALAADALLVFPAVPEGQVAPDHARITLVFDCKARTIKLNRMVFFDAAGAVTKDDTPKTEAQPSVDPTDARLLALACAETFPAADKVFASETTAITAARAPH